MDLWVHTCQNLSNCTLSICTVYRVSVYLNKTVKNRVAVPPNQIQTLFFFFFFLFFSFFFFSLCSTWKFQSQGSNSRYSSNLSWMTTCNDYAVSLTRCTTRELPDPLLLSVAWMKKSLIYWWGNFEDSGHTGSEVAELGRYGPCLHAPLPKEPGKAHPSPFLYLDPKFSDLGFGSHLGSPWPSLQVKYQWLRCYEIESP